MAVMVRLVIMAVSLCACVWLAQPQEVLAGLFGDKEMDKALEGAENDVESLLQILERSDLPFHHSRARKLLAFESLAKESPEDIEPAEINGAQGAYWEFSLPRSLKDVAAYLFNPEVPPHAVYPQSVRMGGWLEPQVAVAGLKPLQGALPDIETPVVFRGTEYEGTTPDVNAGTYYRYELKRLVVGFQDGQGPTIISVSRLQGDSSVGKKGVAFGPPNGWYYFYSGITGNLLTGVGWAESKMYDSISVFVFRETGAGRTKIGLLKWVKAGWKGMNMVKSKHILKGMQEFGKGLQTVLASPAMPAPSAIAQSAKKIAAYPEDKMRQELSPLDALLRESAAKNKDLQRSEFKPLVEGDYLATLTREEMAAELVKDDIRRALDRKALVSGQ